MIDARDQGRIGCNDFTHATFVFKDDNTIGVYIYGWKSFGQSENKPLMKTGKEETTYLLGLTGKCSVKAFVHFPVKGKKDGSPAQEPVIKDGKKRKSCLLDGGKRSGGNGKVTIKKSSSSNITLTLLYTPWRETKDFW